jgi:signal transduction histidine kinase
MQSFPFPARFYMVVIWSLATAVGMASLAYSNAVLLLPLLSLVTLVAFVLADYFEVLIEVKPGYQIGVTVIEAICLFLCGVYGIAGVWIVASGTAVAEVIRRRPVDRIAFNVAMIALCYVFAAFVYTSFQTKDTLPYSGLQGIVAFLMTAGVFYLSNNLILGLMIALATKQSVLKIYREALQDINWVHLFTFPIGAASAALWAIDPWLTIYGALTLFIAHRAFATIAKLNEATKQRQLLAEERADLAEQLAAKQIELAKAENLALLGTFTASLAHEVRNYVTAVVGNAQLALLAEDKVEKDELLHTIERVSRRTNKIMESLLTFSRQREPELHMKLLQPVIGETLALISADIIAAGIELVCTIDAEVPLLLIDDDQMGQVLINLLSNARDAVREKGKGRITISFREVGPHAELIVSDTGAGMSPEMLDRLFQPFATTKKKGNGLGMAICYGIVKNHNGNIRVQSQLGEGTTVTIHLPVDPEVVRAAPPPEVLLVV